MVKSSENNEKWSNSENTLPVTDISDSHRSNDPSLHLDIQNSTQSDKQQGSSLNPSVLHFSTPRSSPNGKAEKTVCVVELSISTRPTQQQTNV